MSQETYTWDEIAAFLSEIIKKNKNELRALQEAREQAPTVVVVRRDDSYDMLIGFLFFLLGMLTVIYTVGIVIAHRLLIGRKKGHGPQVVRGE